MYLKGKECWHIVLCKAGKGKSEGKNCKQKAANIFPSPPRRKTRKRVNAGTAKETANPKITGTDFTLSRGGLRAPVSP